MAKKTKLRKFEDKLDNIFPEYIRLRDMDKPCCSCGQYKEKKDCGHWYSRRHKTVRWDWRNAHGECARCNRFDRDHHIGYTKFMIDKYGAEELHELTESKNAPYHKDPEILERLIYYYTQLIKQLKKEKGL